jgi:hypothetical protein
MPTLNLKVHRRARWAMYQMTDAEQQQIMEAAERLRDSDPADWPKDLVVRLKREKPTYLLQVSPELRAFIGLTGPDEIEIQDVAYAETLKNFQNRQRNGAQQS